MSEDSRAEPVATPTPDDEVRRLTHHLLVLEEIAHQVRYLLETGHGDEQPAWGHPNGEMALTNVDVAHQLINAHMSCAYVDLSRGTIHHEIVLWRERLRWMFSEGRRIAACYGIDGAMDLLSALPPPHDTEIKERAAQLMAEVVSQTKQPLEAARELTQILIEFRRYAKVKKWAIQQGADEKIHNEELDQMKILRYDKNKDERPNQQEDSFAQKLEIVKFLLIERFSNKFTMPE